MKLRMAVGRCCCGTSDEQPLLVDVPAIQYVNNASTFYQWRDPPETYPGDAAADTQARSDVFSLRYDNQTSWTGPWSWTGYLAPALINEVQRIQSIRFRNVSSSTVGAGFTDYEYWSVGFALALIDDEFKTAGFTNLQFEIPSHSFNGSSDHEFETFIEYDGPGPSDISNRGLAIDDLDQGPNVTLSGGTQQLTTTPDFSTYVNDELNEPGFRSGLDHVKIFFRSVTAVQVKTHPPDVDPHFTQVADELEWMGATRDEHGKINVTLSR